MLFLTFSHVACPHLTWHCDAMSNYDITYQHPWHHLWYHHYIIDTAYKRCHTVPIRVHLGSSFLRWGTHACRDWSTDAPTFLEPTSFKDNWLGCCLLLPWVSTLHGCLYIFWKCSVSTAVISTSTVLQDLHTFGWCPCALYSSHWWVLIVESILPQGWHLATSWLAHHNSWHPWVGANWIRVAQIMDLVPPWLRPKSSSVAMGKRKTSIMLSYQDG